MPKPVKARVVRKPTSGRNSGRGANYRAESTSMHSKPAYATPNKIETFATPKASPFSKAPAQSRTGAVRAAKSAVEIRKANASRANTRRRRTV